MGVNGWWFSTSSTGNFCRGGLGFLWFALEYLDSWLFENKALLSSLSDLPRNCRHPLGIVFLCLFQLLKDFGFDDDGDYLTASFNVKLFPAVGNGR